MFFRKLVIFFAFFINAGMESVFRIPELAAHVSAFLDLKSRRNVALTSKSCGSFYKFLEALNKWRTNPDLIKFIIEDRLTSYDMKNFEAFGFDPAVLKIELQSGTLDLTNIFLGVKMLTDPRFGVSYSKLNTLLDFRNSIFRGITDTTIFCHFDGRAVVTIDFENKTAVAGFNRRVDIENYTQTFTNIILKEFFSFMSWLYYDQYNFYTLIHYGNITYRLLEIFHCMIINVNAAFEVLRKESDISEFDIDMFNRKLHKQFCDVLLMYMKKVENHQKIRQYIERFGERAYRLSSQVILNPHALCSSNTNSEYWWGDVVLQFARLSYEHFDAALNSGPRDNMELLYKVMKYPFQSCRFLHTSSSNGCFCKQIVGAINNGELQVLAEQLSLEEYNEYHGGLFGDDRDPAAYYNEFVREFLHGYFFPRR